jgi:hypothetical protein
MHILAITLLFLSIMLEESLSQKQGLTNLTSLTFSIAFFSIGLILLYRVKNVGDISLKK